MRDEIQGDTHRLTTQAVTWRPLSRHFSGLASFFLQVMKAMFSERHLTAICFDAAINTDEVGIGSPAASTLLLAIPAAAKSSVRASRLWWRARTSNGTSLTPASWGEDRVRSRIGSESPRSDKCYWAGPGLDSPNNILRMLGIVCFENI